MLSHLANDLMRVRRIAAAPPYEPRRHHPAPRRFLRCQAMNPNTTTMMGTAMYHGREDRADPASAETIRAPPAKRRSWPSSALDDVGNRGPGTAPSCYLETTRPNGGAYREDVGALGDGALGMVGWPGCPERVRVAVPHCCTPVFPVSSCRGGRCGPAVT